MDNATNTTEREECQTGQAGDPAAGGAGQQWIVGDTGDTHDRRARHTYEGKQRANDGVRKAMIGQAGCSAATMKGSGMSHAGERRSKTDKRKSEETGRVGSPIAGGIATPDKDDGSPGHPGRRQSRDAGLHSGPHREASGTSRGPAAKKTIARKSDEGKEKPKKCFGCRCVHNMNEGDGRHTTAQCTHHSGIHYRGPTAEMQEKHHRRTQHRIVSACERLRSRAEPQQRPATGSGKSPQSSRDTPPSTEAASLAAIDSDVVLRMSGWCGRRSTPFGIHNGP